MDGAGGGTGMSPWRMMNEWGMPPVYPHSLLYRYARKPADKGEYLPAIAVAGGFALEHLSRDDSAATCFSPS